MKNILIDANNMLHRSIGNTEKYLEKNSRATRKLDNKGNDVTALQKFFSDIYYTSSDFLDADTEIYMVWDRKIDPEAINWRTTVNPLYKANRGSIDTNGPKKQVYSLCKHAKYIADAYGFHSVFPLCSEADDLIHYLNKNLEGGSLIISSDHDFFQCISEDCSIYNPQKRMLLELDNWDEYAPVSKEHYVLWKSIKGDPSDNIKGLFRYGEKKAKKLVENWDELSPKLTEEQIDIIEETKSLIDLNFKPLSDKEVCFIKRQIEPKEKKKDWELTRILDNYHVTYKTREMWDNFNTLKELYL
jgi:5'-3' exonuclease